MAENKGVRGAIKKRGGGGSGGAKLPKGYRFIPKDKELIVRFLTGTDEWVSFREGWIGNTPVVVDEDLVEEWQEEHGRWPSTRFLAPAIDVDNNEPIVVQIPLTLAKKFVMREDKLAEKGKDLTDYDYELSKSGSGQDTEYFDDQVGAGKIDLERYADIAIDPNDILEALKERGENASEDEPDIDDDDTDVEVAEKPAEKKKFVFKKKA